MMSNYREDARRRWRQDTRSLKNVLDIALEKAAITTASQARIFADQKFAAAGICRWYRYNREWYG